MWLNLVSLVVNIPIAWAFLLHAIWKRDMNWFWLAAGAASIEMGLEYRLHLERRVQTFRIIRREIFATYNHCDFHQVSMREYFADSPDLFREVLTHLRGGWQASTRLGRKLEEVSGEIMGVPHVILATPKPGSPKPVSLPTPTTFETTDGGWIFTAAPPESSGALTRFLMLHEIGHHGGNLFDADENTPLAILQGVKLVVAVAILVPMTLSNALLAVALFWLAMCRVIEHHVDGPANELTCEVRADEFAIERVSEKHLAPLLKLFTYSRDGVTKEMSLTRTGYVRWQRAADKCLHQLGRLKRLDEWRLGTGPAPKFAFVPVPLILAVLSIQAWRFPSPSLWICKVLCATTVCFLGFYWLRGMGLWYAFRDLRRSQAPIRDRATSEAAIPA